MTVRFQADADLTAEIVAGVRRREPSIDFQTADEASVRRLREPEVLALAAQESRIVQMVPSRTRYDLLQPSVRQEVRLILRPCHSDPNFSPGRCGC